jgi:selenocysteine lyase/cysteine desulfurase
MGPKEAGVLYVRADRTAALWPGMVGVGWGNEPETALVGARRFETLGQRNDATIAGLAAALDFHELLGAERVEARVLALTSALREGLAGIPGVTPVTPADPSMRAGVCIVRIEGVEGRALHERLYERHRIAGAPTGGLRLSPHIYNTMDQIDAAIAAVAEGTSALRA